MPASGLKNNLTFYFRFALECEAWVLTLGERALPLFRQFMISYDTIRYFETLQVPENEQSLCLIVFCCVTFHFYQAHHWKWYPAGFQWDIFLLIALPYSSHVLYNSSIFIGILQALRLIKVGLFLSKMMLFKGNSLSLPLINHKTVKKIYSIISKNLYEF